MILLGIKGPIGHGKSALIEGLQTHEPNSQHIESSAIISKVADSLNLGLRSRPDLITDYDGPSHLGPWLDTALTVALAEHTSQSINSDKLLLRSERVANDPSLYEKLDLYIDRISQKPELLQHTITPDNKESYRPLLQWIGGYVTKSLGYSLWYEELVYRSQLAAQEGTALYVIGGVRFPEDAAVIKRGSGLIIGIFRPDAPMQDAADPTEAQMIKIPVDSHIDNDGTLGQLQDLAGQLLHDIRSGELHDYYQGISFDDTRSTS